MPQISSADKQIAAAKKKLGSAIVRCRGEKMSQRQLALAVGLPPSNMKYIEDGVNAPTHDVYHRLVSVLQPAKTERRKMDALYMTIRHAPPPDVCETLIANQGLIEAVRELGGRILVPEETLQVRRLFESFRKAQLPDT